MRAVKRLILWTLMPIILELAGFIYFNNFYLNDETSFNTKKVQLVSKDYNKINADIPDDAKYIRVSYNGNYISYYENGVINVVDTSDNSKKEISFDDGSTFSAYKWLPDRDIMLIAKKYNDSGTSYMKFESYNAKKDEKITLSDQDNKQVKIDLINSEYDVQHITLSTATNVTYIQIGKADGRSRIYRINVMAQMERTRYNDCMLGNIAVINKKDKLVYEDRTHNRIRVIGMKNPIATGENATHYLLDTDDEDRIYIGNGGNNKVNKIFVVKLNTPRSQWKTIKLKRSVRKSDIYISRAGKIYVNNIADNTVIELESGKEIHYKGKLVKMYDCGVLSKSDGKLVGNF